MRRIAILLLFSVLSTAQLFSQIPFFKAETGLESTIYAHTSFSTIYAYNKVNTYTTVQYRVGSVFLGADLTTGINESNLGFVVRLARDYSPYFNFGLQLTPSFALNKQFKLNYTYLNIYLNGAIPIFDEKFYWVSNTLWFSRNFKQSVYTQYTYLGYKFEDLILPGLDISPILAESHSWLFDSEFDLGAGMQVFYDRFTLSVLFEKFAIGKPVFRFGLSAQF